MYDRRSIAYGGGCGGGIWPSVVVFAILFVIWCVVFFRYRDDDDYPADSSVSSRSNGGSTVVGRRRRRLAAMVEPSVSSSSSSSENRRLFSRVDCSVSTKYCTSDTDCASMCRSYDAQKVMCDPLTHVCNSIASTAAAALPSSVQSDDNAEKEKEICDWRLGEYAMLVGYSSLGTAQWKCVRLYNHFNDTVRFCEGGVFEMDATRREPSYRDCACPEGTVLMIKRQTDQYDIGLPHCVDLRNKRFFDEDMTSVNDDDDGGGGGGGSDR